MATLVSRPLKAEIYVAGGTSVVEDELRLLRASALYADAVKTFWIGPMLALAAKEQTAAALADITEFAHAYCTARVALGHDLPPGLDPHVEDEARLAGPQIRAALRSGVLLSSRGRLEDPEAVFVAGPDRGPSSALLDFLRWGTRDETGQYALNRGSVGAALIGELEAFPDADMDVILDVRDRLTASRVYFTTVVANAVAELKHAATESEDLAALIADLRAREIDEALARIRDELTGLGVRRTLLRMTRDKFTVTSAGATITMAVGSGGGTALHALLSAAIGAPLLAAAAGEAEHRAEVREDLKGWPYWHLHEAGRLLKQRV